jgi:hypothetical protein
MTMPSPSDRHAARLARVRALRWVVLAGIGLGLAAGLFLTLSAEEGPIRVIGVLILAINLLLVPLTLAVFRVPPANRPRRR